MANELVFDGTGRVDLGSDFTATADFSITLPKVKFTSTTGIVLGHMTIAGNFIACIAPDIIRFRGAGGADSIRKSTFNL